MSKKLYNKSGFFFKMSKYCGQATLNATQRNSAAVAETWVSKITTRSHPDGYQITNSSF
jgi:hypothetical protein